MTADNGHSIGLKGIRKLYGPHSVAVESLDLDIRAGEFFSLLGPSGCGKTTTLRMIAGFEVPTKGQVSVDGQDVTTLPAHARSMGMVFQNYALFPHMTVLQNVAFGLKMRRVSKADALERTQKALAQVELTGFEGRYPGQLSGGQQQRVALARAIVISPKVLLCDEPLGALDKKLRAAMQFELKELQRALGVTLVYVTHDQEEALTMSDRIAVMNKGRIEQIGSPDEIYNRPATAFVSGFIGDSNLFDGVLESGPSGLSLKLDDGDVLPVGEALQSRAGERVTLALRPEHLRFAETGMPATLKEANFLGASTLYKVETARQRALLIRVPAGAAVPDGASVHIAIRPEAAVLVRHTAG